MTVLRVRGLSSSPAGKPLLPNSEDFEENRRLFLQVVDYLGWAVAHDAQKYQPVEELVVARLLDFLGCFSFWQGSKRAS